MVDQAERPGEHDVASSRFAFERWARECAGDVRRVGGAYSRAAWLPVVGPTAWLIWGAVADQLRDTPWLDCSLEDLGRPWGFDAEDVSWSLLQLARYGLALPGRDDRWRVHTSCPPLHGRLLEAAPPSVRAMHRRRLRPPSWAVPRGLRWGSGHLISAARPGL